MSPPRFDRVIVVDGSASSVPKLGRDSIWLAVAEPDVSGGPARLVHVENLPTRATTVDRLVELSAAEGVRTLVGVDWSLGFPVGTAEAMSLGDGAKRPWEAMWGQLSSSVVDDERNRNNRFDVAAELNRRAGEGPGPFWGAPATRATNRLTSTKVDPDPLPTWRDVEAVLRGAGRRPFSCWQLTGAGAVGSQSLVGIPLLARVLDRSSAQGVTSHVWPFTTGLAMPVAPPNHGGAEMIVAEVWPSMFDIGGDVAPGRVRDEAQVRAVARRLASLDARGELARWFRPALDDVVARHAVDEEGWTLGVGVGD